MTEFEPTTWCVVFNLEAEAGWARWVPGRFKHVRAFAFVPATGIWLFYDVHFGGTQIFAVAGDRDDPKVKAAIYSFIGPSGSSYVVGMSRLPARRRLFPWSNWCTSSLRHLLNLPGGALRPDAFYRDCLANGGTPFEADDGRRTEIYPTP